MRREAERQGCSGRDGVGLGKGRRCQNGERDPCWAGVAREEMYKCLLLSHE